MNLLSEFRRFTPGAVPGRYMPETQPFNGLFDFILLCTGFYSPAPPCGFPFRLEK